MPVLKGQTYACVFRWMEQTECVLIGRFVRVCSHSLLVDSVVLSQYMIAVSVCCEFGKKEFHACNACVGTKKITTRPRSCTFSQRSEHILNSSFLPSRWVPSQGQTVLSMCWALIHVLVNPRPVEGLQSCHSRS